MNETQSSELSALIAAANTWCDEDPDAHTRAALRALIEGAATDEHARAELKDCFRANLGFGTAGLRGALGPGPNRMNRVVVMKAAAALGAFLYEISEGDTPGLVVVGYDARHNSDQFARDTCAVLSGVGIPVAVFPTHCPTPVLAFAVQHLNAAAGVMVTASHNPAADNGYKVYLGPGSGLDYRGSQIVPPVDGRIAELMSEVERVQTLPLADEWLTLDDAVLDAYVQRAASVVCGPSPAQLRVVHTAMHGVGASAFATAARAAGFTHILDVTEQMQPDPDFPTVAFPNPEEPGALDLAYAHATEVAADVIIAHDPDADRCAVALPSPAHGVGEPTDFAGVESRSLWQRLSGDDVGLLLGWWRLEQHRLGVRPLSPAATFASSIVSGSLLRRLCQRHGVTHMHTLTGFKWLARIPNFAYGYEEALGYCVDPDAVHDKDGISASLAVLDCLAHLRARGTTALELLAQLRDDLGGGVTHNISVTLKSADAASRLLSSLLHNPPSNVGGLDVVSVDDMSNGIDGLPPTSGVRWQLSAQERSPWRVIIRPSGTEPKVKCYVEAASEASAQAIAADCEQLIHEAE